MTLELDLDFGETTSSNYTLTRTLSYPRLRFMGSKFKVLPSLVNILSDIPFDTVLDAFSGSGVVSYALKEMGKQVVANDFLNFTSTVATALIENPGVTLSEEDVHRLLSPNSDGRNFIQNKFQGLYFPDEDHAFLDAVWSHIELLPRFKRELALSSLFLAAVRKQPRGVFTVTTFRYDDGRRNLRMPLRELFQQAVAEYNCAVFDNQRHNRVICQDIFDVDPSGFDLVYLDPPYVSTTDDNDYIKRYHFLEGLSVYWRGQKIMEDTATKKIAKRYTAFAYKHTMREAFRELFYRFRKSTLVLSYGSNSVPNKQELLALLSEEKQNVQSYSISHRYSFGNHVNALRRKVEEYVFVAK